MNIKNVATSVVARIRATIDGDINTVVKTFDKLAAKLERLIAKGHADLEAATRAIDALNARRVSVNSDLDRAYRVFHNITELTK